MRRYAFIIAAAVIALLSAACDEDFGPTVRGSGSMITETRAVSGFEKIVILGSGTVVVDVTGTESLEIEAEDNIMPLLTTEVRGGRLELGSDGSFSTSRGITYTITAAALEGTTINGSGDITVTGIDSDSFEVTINGSGDVAPAGTSTQLTVNINGSGDFNGTALVSATGEVRVSGSGRALVNVTNELDVTISGSGDVQYLGNPQLTQNISGSGSVSSR